MEIKMFISQAEALRLSEALAQVMHPNIQTFKTDQIILNNLKTFGNLVLQADAVQTKSLTEQYVLTSTRRRAPGLVSRPSSLKVL